MKERKIIFILGLLIFIFFNNPILASQLKRSYLILNLTDLNDLPKANRWLFK